MRRHSGFTLIEVLIVVAILAILTIIALVSLAGKRDRADDAKIKADLDRLKIAFEDYYNDHNCYPPATWFDGPEDCSSEVFRPYLPTILCDRQTGRPYRLETDASGCDWFKLYGQLKNTYDQSYYEFLDGSDQLIGTYAVSSSNVNAYPESAGGTAGSGTPYYCQGVNNCSLIPANKSCNPAYADSNCGGDPGDKCSSLSTCSDL